LSGDFNLHQAMPHESLSDQPSEGVQGKTAVSVQEPAISQWTNRDWMMALSLFTLGLSAVLLVTRACGGAIEPNAIHERWFASDSGRVLADMSDFNANRYRVKVHPIFPLLSYPIVRGLMTIMGLSPLEAVSVFNAFTAGAWLAVLYAMMRHLDCPRLDSTLFTLVAGTSTAAMFWFIIPETYPLGSLTILLALGAVTLAGRRMVPDWWFAAASALSLSITVTNWMAGLIATAVCRPPRRALAITLIALAAVFVLVVVQRTVLPGTNGSIFNPRGILAHETAWVMTEQQGGPVAAARVFFLTSAVAPRTELSRFEQTPIGPMFSFQRSPVGSNGALGLVATVLWGLLLIAGLVALVAGRGDARFRIALGATLIGQFALHLLYGDETFLYALNYTPLLVLTASLAALGRARYAVVVIALALLPCAAWNNARELQRVLTIPPHAKALVP
jgi:hypothetical protein